MKPPPATRALDELAAAATATKSLAPAIDAAGELLVATLRAGGKILACGNGGSAADASHLAEELVGRYRASRRPLPALSLAADPAALTCIANDFGFEHVFSRQVEALAAAGDVLVGFTTSGNSPNIVAAFAAARARGVKTILVSARDGGRCRGACDHELLVPTASPARAQELHTFILHCWLEQIEAAFPAVPS
ncbi:MAG TPA: SIS domain-containing protein [Opitutus sp.]|nr:SIS domain-containing protein [Opitutus sp.]